MKLLKKKELEAPLPQMLTTYGVRSFLDKEIKVWKILLTIIGTILTLSFVLLLVEKAEAYVPTIPLEEKHIRPSWQPVRMARWNESLPPPRGFEQPIIISESAEWSKSEIFFAYNIQKGQKTFCYIIDDGWYRWCEGWDENKPFPTLEMYNGKGYKVFDFEWLKWQMFSGSKTQYDNANRWVLKIMRVKKG